jgi:hemerythrin-like domain-containing protein
LPIILTHLQKEESMETGTLTSRRRFLFLTGGLAAGITLLTAPPTLLAAEAKEGTGKEPEVNPLEDLMREHGVLQRVLLVYEEIVRLLNGGRDVPQGVIADSAGIIRRFIEDYHERLEEDEIFPRLIKAGKHADLVRVLIDQHQAGRRLTDTILTLSRPVEEKVHEEQEQPAALKEIYDSRPLFGNKMGSKPHPKGDTESAMRKFITMYRPHAAREDTVIFPAFPSIVTPREFDELGEKFENREKQLFGTGGFEKIVSDVAEIERKLGIYELARFTANA